MTPFDLPCSLPWVEQVSEAISLRRSVNFLSNINKGLKDDLPRLCCAQLDAVMRRGVGHIIASREARQRHWFTGKTEPTKRDDLQLGHIPTHSKPRCSVKDVISLGRALNASRRQCSLAKEAWNVGTQLKDAERLFTNTLSSTRISKYTGVACTIARSLTILLEWGICTCSHMLFTLFCILQNGTQKIQQGKLSMNLIMVVHADNTGPIFISRGGARCLTFSVGLSTNNESMATMSNN